jgi:hypothetical protein
MNLKMQWAGVPVWAWGTMGALAIAVVITQQRRNAVSNAEAPQIVRSPGVTQVQPLIITPPGNPSQPNDVSGNVAANYYGGI